jgi:hypothetical protein
MGRASRAGGAALASACTLLAWGTLAAGAQDLPRLHITALGLHADRATVAAGETYHITVHVHVTERRDRLDELQLPAFTNATDLGDERRRVPNPGGGTDFYEIMTVSSPDPGTAAFTAAYIDAIDPATDRGMRYSSNPLTVRVTPAAGAAPEPGAIDSVTQSVRRAFRDAIVFAGVALVALAILIAVVRRRPRRPRPAPVPPAVRVARPELPPVDALRAAVADFRTRNDDASLDVIRNLLFTRAGAATGATLTDALRALGARDPDLARAMAVAERVRFGPRAQRADATRDLFDALANMMAAGVSG